MCCAEKIALHCIIEHDNYAMRKVSVPPSSFKLSPNFTNDIKYKHHMRKFKRHNLPLLLRRRKV